MDDYSATQADILSSLKWIRETVRPAAGFSLLLVLVGTVGVATNTFVITVTSASVILFSWLVLIFSAYMWRRVNRNMNDLDHLSYHMAELEESRREIIFRLERTDTRLPSQQQYLQILRKIDSSLDELLEEEPKLLVYKFEVKGKKSSATASLFIGEPWAGLWERLREGGLRSRFADVWVVFEHVLPEPMSLPDIRAIHDSLSDALRQWRPPSAVVYVFSKSGFTEETIKFVENEKTWIPHWHVGSENEESAVINLAKVESDGTFTVVSMPWLKAMREDRLVTALA
jgi:hypothetical protein